MRPLVILNPRSQGGKTGARAPELLRAVERHLGQVDNVATSAPRHATALAERAARQGREVVIAVGGDGTLHEVANGLLAARADGVSVPKLGLVGRGTGGDFRKTLGIDNALETYCQVIAAGKTHRVDAGALHYHDTSGAERHGFFINIVSMGMAGLVDAYVAELGRSLPGPVAYFAASARALLRSQVGELRCVLTLAGREQEVQLASRNLAVCNGRYFGSGMQVAPMAELDDGIFEVVSLGAAPRVRFALSSLSIYSGKHVDKPGVQVLRCERIDIRLGNPEITDRFPLDVDGEPLGLLPVRLEVLPGALEVFCQQ